MRPFFAVVLAALASAILAAPAAAAPVATSAPEYQAYGAVFPDPLADCQQTCDPRSRGRVSATSFIQWQEFNDALEFMNTQDDWRRYMEVWPLDGKKGEGGGTKAGDEMWPGNNLEKLEWRPDPDFQSAGLATTQRTRQKSDLIVIRVTDENVPDADKKRYALSLSIHGIERAGVEGGTRAMEELVTAAAEGRGDDPVLPKEVREGAPTLNEVLANTIIYFTFPNPDGWRRGSAGDTDKGPGVFFQRYNGNGIDPNRDWADIGYTFRPYSGNSEPETRAFQSFYRDVEERGGQFAAGDDLHGQPFADALSYTLMPHGRHNLDKDYRIREASKLINRAQYEATKWSPLIQDNDEPPPECIPEDAQALGAACDQIYAQTWGSVYDTINYTTTGTLGDWFDSNIGLGADGIDNEMSFSHLDRNVAFEPQGEQLHVSGNKAIIYSHIADLLRPPGAAYQTPGSNGYVPNFRLKRAEQTNQPAVPPGTTPQEDIADEAPDPAVSEPGPPPSTGFGFTVERDADTYSGGMRVDVRATNAQGIGAGVATLQVQCRGCDRHGTTPDDWVTVAEDYNQSPLYAQAGLTAAVNDPQPFKPDGSPVEWRALVSAPGGIPSFSVDFTSGPATSDANTGGGAAPFLAAYDVANTDFFDDLNGESVADNDEFSGIDPLKVISGEQNLAGLDTLVLADNPLPGYTGTYKGEDVGSGPPTADFEFAPTKPTTPGQGPESCEQNDATTEYKPFAIAANDGNLSVDIRVEWSETTTDYDLFLYTDKNGNGVVDADDTEVTGSAGFINNSEEISILRPPAGSYVIAVVNCAAPPTDTWTGTVDFNPFPPAGESTTTEAQKNAWMGKLSEWVNAGGTLVLTDAALRALPELTSIPGAAVTPQVVYVGQTSFQVCETANAEDPTVCDTTKETLDDPLAKNVDQPGARFNTGMRRQTFEPTPLGFAIQNRGGSDASFSIQYQVDQAAFVAAGGRPVGSSTTSSPDAAVPVTTQTVLGEMPVGQGRIRVLGALLPQPSELYDHPLGLEPYAITYTGYILFCNLIDCQYERKARPALPNEAAPPGPVQVGFGAKLTTPLLASTSTRNGRRVPVRIRKSGVKEIARLQVQYRRTGRGTRRTYKRLFPRLKPSTKRIRFRKGKIGETYLLRIRAHGKSGVTSAWDYARIVFPYDDRGKSRKYSSAWTRVKNRRAWKGGYTRTSTRGATLRFKTRGGGRVYLIGRTAPNGGRAVIRARGGERRVVSFKSKKVRNRRVVAIINRTDKRALRFKLRVLRGVVSFDALGIRRR